METFRVAPIGGAIDARAMGWREVLSTGPATSSVVLALVIEDAAIALGADVTRAGRAQLPSYPAAK